MNFKDSIELLGSVNSATCYPKKYNEINLDLPYIRISNGKIDMFNYKTHDNAPRMSYVCQFLSEEVLPNVKGNVNGYFNIQLHDTYTYLNDGINYKDVLCFGKNKSHKGPVMLPDCYFMGDWGKKYHNVADNLKFEQKIDKICFYGTTTGNKNPLLNERIQTCLWAIDKPVCDFYITKIAQIEPSDIIKNIHNFNNIYAQPIDFNSQSKYKYQLRIDGNTRKWDADAYFINSLALALPSKDMLWYESLINENTHFVEVTQDTMINKFNYFQENGNEAKLIIQNANRLANQLFNFKTAKDYTISLFENIAFNK
jgi:hypothetical protein